MKPFGVLLLAAGFLLGIARADEPLQPPHRFTVCSASKRSCVTSDPEQGTFAHTPDRPSIDSALWKIPQWFRVLYASDNPDLVVTGFDGMNLVSADSPGAVQVLAFWRRGKLVRAYKLSSAYFAPLRHTFTGATTKGSIPTGTFVSRQSRVGSSSSIQRKALS
jgi:hypothetical protein